MWEHAGSEGGGLQRIWDFDAEPDPPPAGWWDQMGLFHPFSRHDSLIDETANLPAALLSDFDLAGAEWDASMAGGNSAVPSFYSLAQPSFRLLPSTQNVNDAAPVDALPASLQWSSAAAAHGGAGAGAQSWSERISGLQRSRVEAKGLEPARVASIAPVDTQHGPPQQMPQYATSSVGTLGGASGGVSAARAPKPPREKDKKKSNKHGASKRVVLGAGQQVLQSVPPQQSQQTPHQARDPQYPWDDPVGATPVPARKDSTAIFQVLDSLEKITKNHVKRSPKWSHPIHLVVNFLKWPPIL
jgi:hypothetical protein